MHMHKKCIQSMADFFCDSPIYKIFYLEKKKHIFVIHTYKCDVYILNKVFKLMPMSESIA